MVTHAQSAIIFNSLFIPSKRVTERRFSYLALAFMQGHKAAWLRCLRTADTS